MSGRLLPHVVNVTSASRVKGEMAKPSLSAIVIERKPTLFKNDVGVPKFPADPLSPRLELPVAEPCQ